ncbi:hypothetical protein O181_092146 [Austropuccinia psidii MF-1]|uniref:Uncharacterized protein n=1 Tax=Austropuccinia psidii MF-1 TaxID=1389203 RepID=A0A9Q3IYS9_9BASI|nr:hypothetical protein [Austropuccinia psidii MF-1]
MTLTRQLGFLILLVLSVWPGARIAVSTKILYLQSEITVSLERGHVVVLECQLLMSRGIYGVGKSPQFLRHLLLTELQGIPIVSNLSTLIKIGTDILDVVTCSRKRDVTRWTNVGGPIPIGGRPIYSSSEVPISRINTEGVVKRIRRIADYPTDPDAEGNDELDGEEVVVVPHSVDHQSSTSYPQPLSNRFQSQVIPSTPRTFQPVLASIPTSLPPASPSPSPCQACLESSSKTITQPETKELNHNHLSTTPTYGQFQ